ncbi:MAG: PIN domain-containing protein [Bacteroidales bacterium]|jgi:predicted nucleic acid-binding protein|nr:PIN domain-containing protein [Bacteroidales bacterium]MDD2285214.1 PIN domain-containing protein [Paludibacter sp.]MDD4428856.1 PIN domain-containing protein [Paludibacter sp.]
MNRILLDTNIILDIALERREFFKKSKDILRLITQKNLPAYLTATTATDIYYILKKSKGHKSTIEFLIDLFGFIEVCDVSSEVIMNALQSNLSDFEDAVQVESARQNGIGIIITRNKADFVKSDVVVFTPDEFFQQYQRLK